MDVWLCFVSAFVLGSFLVCRFSATPYVSSSISPLPTLLFAAVSCVVAARISFVCRDPTCAGSSAERTERINY